MNFCILKFGFFFVIVNALKARKSWGDDGYILLFMLFCYSFIVRLYFVTLNIRVKNVKDRFVDIDLVGYMFARELFF